jgi:hypothetical protein
MFESKREPGKKFGSIYKQRRFDGYAGSPQPGETNENEHAEPQQAGQKDENVVAPKAASESADEIRGNHGLAHTVTYTHDHDGGSHKVSSTHEDGTSHESEHGSAKEAIEHGARLAWDDSAKKREKYPQDGAESEEQGFEAPNLVM